MKSIIMLRYIKQICNGQLAQDCNHLIKTTIYISVGGISFSVIL